MKTTNFKLVRETEKAFCYVIGFKFNENAKQVKIEAGGAVIYDTGCEVTAWIPKSQITDGVVAEWLMDKKIKESFGRMGLRDLVYHENIHIRLNQKAELVMNS